MQTPDRRFDVAIVGAGPAGLSAALLLGRSRRRVLVIDDGHRRNSRSRHLHGFLSRDGIPPGELLAIAREELRPYSTVQLESGQVTDIVPGDEDFQLALADGTDVAGRKVLLATGVVDELPELSGILEFHGRGVFVCPYCDGWEVRDQPLVAYGAGDSGRRMALELLCWSEQVTLCTNGPAELNSHQRERLAHAGVALAEQPIERLEGGDALERLQFANGDVLPCKGFFIAGPQHQRSPLLDRLGCELNERGTAATGEYATTNIPGLYVAGDASRGLQLAIVAAAEGAKAAFAINSALLHEDLS